MSRDATDTGRGLSRRGFLFGGAAAGVGAAVALGVERTLPAQRQAELDAAGLNGARTVAFHGEHQAGIDTPIASHATYLGLDLHDDTDRAALARMMRVLSDDASRLTAGEGALADTEPELATVPAALTVTFGFGPELVRRGGGASAVPSWLGALPAFDIDALEDRWSGGDLLILVSSDDAVTVAHAVRMLLKDSRSFATLKWRQDGFRRAYGSEVSGTTMRNLFGQVDGTTNPEPGTADFDRVVWAGDGWLAGGTSIVLRRIRLDLDVWDEVDPVARSFSVGRDIHTGAPLTGTREADEPDFEATTAAGNTVISPVSHIARSRPVDSREVIFRRGYNYDVAPTGDGVSESGLIFACFQADVDAQFVPIQRRLAEGDLLNTWTTPIGSAVFAIPPGCEPGGYVGETLLG
ncbi:Dyp-type peroxidase [Demequina sp. NBRC 110057]|uniref:Dyp-type peroxidase n=1 Tax=Demequina sp. NBRC 110057 TaxID=1570346 RepID=UPI0009FBFF61|nr:Dyp-type peroxidase [Demequina sp. NBRC 110057]